MWMRPERRALFVLLHRIVIPKSGSWVLCYFRAKDAHVSFWRTANFTALMKLVPSKELQSAVASGKLGDAGSFHLLEIARCDPAFACRLLETPEKIPDVYKTVILKELDEEQSKYSVNASAEKSG